LNDSTRDSLGRRFVAADTKRMIRRRESTDLKTVQRLGTSIMVRVSSAEDMVSAYTCPAVSTGADSLRRGSVLWCLSKLTAARSRVVGRIYRRNGIFASRGGDPEQDHDESPRTRPIDGNRLYIGGCAPEPKGTAKIADGELEEKAQLTPEPGRWGVLGAECRSGCRSVFYWSRK